MGRRLNRIVRPRVKDPTLVHLMTAAAGDGHRHCVTIDEQGNGESAPGPDGHQHQVEALEVLAEADHRHILSTERCPREHEGSQCL